MGCSSAFPFSDDDDDDDDDDNDDLLSCKLHHTFAPLEALTCV
jgi:hypothetical protein